MDHSITIASFVSPVQRLSVVYRNTLRSDSCLPSRQFDGDVLRLSAVRAAGSVILADQSMNPTLLLTIPKPALFV